MQTITMTTTVTDDDDVTLPPRKSESSRSILLRQISPIERLYWDTCVERTDSPPPSAYDQLYNAWMLTNQGKEIRSWQESYPSSYDMGTFANDDDDAILSWQESTSDSSNDVPMGRYEQTNESICRLVGQTLESSSPMDRIRLERAQRYEPLTSRLVYIFLASIEWADDSLASWMFSLNPHDPEDSENAMTLSMDEDEDDNDDMFLLTYRMQFHPSLLDNVLSSLAYEVPYAYRLLVLEADPDIVQYDQETFRLTIVIRLTSEETTRYLWKWLAGSDARVANPSIAISSRMLSTRPRVLQSWNGWVQVWNMSLDAYPSLLLDRSMYFLQEDSPAKLGLVTIERFLRLQM